MNLTDPFNWVCCFSLISTEGITLAVFPSFIVKYAVREPLAEVYRFPVNCLLSSYTLTEFKIPIITTPILYGDNMAVVDFVDGRGSAKGVRHMALRLWYCREQTLLQNVDVDHMDGDKILADKLIKRGSVDDHSTFVIDILGLALLGITGIRSYVSCHSQDVFVYYVL